MACPARDGSFRDDIACHSGHAMACPYGFREKSKRRIYTACFWRCIVNLATSTGFALMRQWWLAFGFFVGTLIFLAVAVRQYRDVRKVGDDAIERYQKWWDENRDA